MPAKKAAPKHPAYLELVKEAIAATAKPVKGASRASIVKYLTAKYGMDLGKSFRPALRMALRKAAAKGVVVQTKGSFRLTKAAKKATKVKKPKAKKVKKPKAKKVKKPKAKKVKKPKAKKVKAPKPSKKGTKAKAATKPKKATKPRAKKTPAPKAPQAE